MVPVKPGMLALGVPPQPDSDSIRGVPAPSDLRRIRGTITTWWERFSKNFHSRIHGVLKGILHPDPDSYW